MQRTQLLLFITFITLTKEGYSDSIPNLSGDQLHKGYYKILEEKLIRPFSKQILGIYLVIPSFEPEYILLLDDENGKRFLRYRKFNENLHYTLNKEKYPEIRSVNIKISKDIQKLVEEFIKEAYACLLKNKHSGGLDGTNYYFMIPDSSHTKMLRSENWSPEKDSESYRVIEKAEAIVKYVVNPKRKDGDLKKKLKN